MASITALLLEQCFNARDDFDLWHLKPYAETGCISLYMLFLTLFTTHQLKIFEMISKTTEAGCIDRKLQLSGPHNRFA